MSRTKELFEVQKKIDTLNGKYKKMKQDRRENYLAKNHSKIQQELNDAVDAFLDGTEKLNNK